MGQIIVRNLDDDVIARLKERALKANQSLEQTVRDILSAAAKPSRADALAEADRIREAIRARHGGSNVVLDPTELIREDRDNDEPFR
jgi:plasmid stability protein